MMQQQQQQQKQWLIEWAQRRLWRIHWDRHSEHLSCIVTQLKWQLGHEPNNWISISQCFSLLCLFCFILFVAVVLWFWCHMNAMAKRCHCNGIMQLATAHIANHIEAFQCDCVHYVCPLNRVCFCICSNPRWRQCRLNIANKCEAAWTSAPTTTPHSTITLQATCHCGQTNKQTYRYDLQYLTLLGHDEI